MSLDVKKEKAKIVCFLLRIKCSKQCRREFFRALNASGKVHPLYFQVSEHQERNSCWFWRLKDTDRVLRLGSICCKWRKKSEPMYLEVKLKKNEIRLMCLASKKQDRKNDWFISTLKCSKQCMREAEINRVRNG